MTATPGATVLTLAIRTLKRAGASILPFARFYCLPWLVGALVLVAARIFRQEQFQIPLSATHWSDSILWAPFMAIVAVLTLRHMASKQLVSQSAETVFNDALGYVALILAAFFMLESQLLVVENSLTTSYVHYLYDPVSSQALSGSELIEKFGSSLIIFRNTVTICTLALKAGFMAVAAGVLWNLALVQDFSFKESLATFRANALYLFAFFFVFEIIFHQLFLLYTVLVIYLPLEWPDTSISLSWRRHVVPQFVRELVWMPIHFVVTLIALSSIAEVQLFLTGRSAA